MKIDPVRVRIALAAGIGIAALLTFTWFTNDWGKQTLRGQANTSLTTSIDVVAQSVGATLAAKLQTVSRIAAIYGDMNLAEDGAMRRRVLDNLHDRLAGIAWAGVALADGTILDGSEGERVGGSAAGQEWLRRGLAGPSMAYSHDPAAQGPVTVELAAPIHDGHGQVTGVLALQLDAGWLTRPIDDVAAALGRAAITDVAFVGASGDIIGPLPIAGSIAARGSFITATVPITNRLVARDLGWKVTARQSSAFVDAPAARFATANGVLAGVISAFVVTAVILAVVLVQSRLSGVDRRVLHLARLIPGSLFDYSRDAAGQWQGRMLKTAVKGSFGLRAGSSFDLSILAEASEDHRQAYLSAMNEAVAAVDVTDRPPTEAMFCMPAPDGAIVWRRVFFRARRDPRRGIVVEALSVDETALKRAEVKAQSAQELAERGRRLEEENRLLAEQRAAASGRLARQRSDILAVMAHEIRTPLNGLIGFAELLSEGELTAEQQDQAETVLQSGRVLLAVVNDVLDLAKLDAGKVSIETISFSPAETLRQSLVLCQTLCAEKGLQMVLEVTQDVPEWAAGDPTRLRQIVGNLLTNAVKFTERGAVILRAWPVAAAPGGGMRLRVEVQDSGIGIPLDAQPRLFTMFEQVEQGTARRFGGTGLGLAISRRLVEAMGGEIGVLSAPNKGSLFWFEVPFGAAAAPALADARPVELPGRRLSVLAADDTATNRALLRAYLTGAGHRVTLVDDGVAAVSAAADERFDLILMDVNMPNMDGLEAARRIRAGGPNARTVMLAVTAGASAEDRFGVLDAGMDGHLTKPLGRPALLAAIKAHFVTGASEALAG